MTRVKGHEFTQKGNKVELWDVMCIPNLRDNLFSITKEMPKGAKVTNEGEALVVTCPDGRAMRFDYALKTHRGHSPGAVLKPLGADKTVDECNLKDIDRKFFHSAGCHQDENRDKVKTKHLGHKLVGKKEKCIHCTRGNVQRKMKAKEKVAKE